MDDRGKQKKTADNGTNHWPLFSVIVERIRMPAAERDQTRPLQDLEGFREAMRINIENGAESRRRCPAADKK